MCPRPSGVWFVFHQRAGNGVMFRIIRPNKSYRHKPEEKGSGRFMAWFGDVIGSAEAVIATQGRFRTLIPGSCESAVSVFAS